MTNALASSSLLFAFAAALAAQQTAAPTTAPTTGQERLTFEQTRQPIQWTGQPPAVGIAWDGQHVEVLDKKASVWIDPRTGKNVEPKVRPAGAPNGSAAATGFRARIDQGNVVLEQIAGGGNDRGGGRRRGGRDGGGRAVEGSTKPLTDDGAKHPARREAHASGDGAFASFVEDNNLWIVDAAQKQPWQVTPDGGPELFHGLLDWVYQEEVYGRGNFQGHWWSARSGMCAFLTLDESPVKDYTLVEHVPEGFLDRERSVIAEVSNYPKAGDPNPIARLSVADAQSRRVVPLDLAAYPKDVLVVRVEWTDDDRLLITLQDRIQTWADLCEADPKTGKLTRWIREESKTWTNRPDAPRWLPDGTFLWLSERTGMQHVYRYKAGGGLVNAITSGDWQVRSIVRVDAAQQVLWFEGTKDGASGRHLYRVNFDSKGLVLLTPGPGTHDAELSADGSFLIDRWSSTEQPPSVRLCDGATGAVTKELGAADMGAAAKYAFRKKQFTTITARDGCALDATVLLPIDWQPGRKYPVWLPTYSGPDAPSVRDAWSYSTFDVFLAQQGFIVLQVNVRSASNRGQTFIGTCYKQLGVQELQDLEDAVDQVCKTHGGDPARVAISGWSYGGFMTAYALTHSDKFALGFAGAGVYDWRLYDSIYTERYMGLPDDNKAGYDATSVIKAAKNLRGHLVLMHGTMDDNVHVQNTIQLLWELEKANKQNFELMLYPRSQHGLAPQVGLHQYTFQWLRLQKLLDPNWKP